MNPITEFVRGFRAARLRRLARALGRDLRIARDGDRLVITSADGTRYGGTRAELAAAAKVIDARARQYQAEGPVELADAHRDLAARFRAALGAPAGK